MTDESTSSDERTLAEVLTYLNPPQQDYESLAAEIGSPDDYPTPFEGALAAFFEMFANGYAYWQQVYDYARVFEYFYGGYAEAEPFLDEIRKGDVRDRLRSFMMNTVLTFVHNTGCENGLICNEPDLLYRSARSALGYATRALELWNGFEIQQEIAETEKERRKDKENFVSLSSPVNDYLSLSKLYFEGVMYAAQLSLLPYKRDWQHADVETLQRQAHKAMHDLRPLSRELLSELHAYYSSATHAIDKFEKRGRTSLRVQQADILLRAIGYVGPKLVDDLFHAFREVEGIEKIIKKAKVKGGLDVAFLHSSGFLNDSFRTEAGAKRPEDAEADIERLEGLTFDIPSGDGILTIQIQDGDKSIIYDVESFSATVSELGTISIEFGFSAGDTEDTGTEGITPSHVRILESLIGPHVGDLEIVWRGAPQPQGRGVDELVRPEATNYVRYYLAAADWLEEGEAAGYFPVSENNTLDSIRKFHGTWKNLLKPVADQLFKSDRDTLKEERRQNRYQLQRALQDTRREFRKWEWLHNTTDDTEALQKFKLAGQKLFPQGRVYSKLSDVAQEVATRIKAVLFDISGLTIDDDDDDGDENGPTPIDLNKCYLFDQYSGWQSIVNVNQLSLMDADGNMPEFPTEAQQKEILNHDEFKAFEIAGREARAGIDDWLMASPPKYQENLALIRSHVTDVMIMGQNRAFMYFPDDPQFILDQYLDSARYVGDLRVIALAHVVAAKRLVEVCESVLNSPSAENHNKRIAEQLTNIQVLRRQIADVFERIQDITLTRYQDHSDLIRAMLDAIDIDRYSLMLTDMAKTLDMLYGHLRDNRLTAEVEQTNK